MKMNENKNELKNKCVSFMLKFATLKVYASSVTIITFL